LPKTSFKNKIVKVKKLKFIALTHTESKYNAARLFCGTTESTLSDKGHAQAKDLAKKLKSSHIDVAYVSPLKRTRQTAQYILKFHPKAKVIKDSRIIERDYGKLTKLNKDKYFKKHPRLGKIYHRSYSTPPPGGESMKQVEKRVLSFINEVKAKMKKEKINVLVICHSNSIRPIIKHFEKLSSKEMMDLENLRYKIFQYKV
jgi:2,3-bisphosphoglycerate-dependent phosphoglycerate mutase